jgi:hypothetical protein
MKRLFSGLNLAGLTLAAVTALCFANQPASAQNGFFGGGRSVGGVSINTQGIVTAPTAEDQQQLDEVRKNALEEVPADLEAYTDLRAVSLKQLEATLADCAANNKPIPDAVRFLAGLQRIEYVLVYPDRNDVVLAGPAEAWRIDAMGNVVGATTSRPVVLLEDLVVALRTSEASRLEAISCSIDPTAEGIRRVRTVLSHMRTVGNRQPDSSRIEKAMGPQVVSVTGVPASSHFARVMVAADFRMKQMAMNFMTSPVDNMPSFMQLISTSRKKASNLTPRWWLATNYEPLARDAKGLAWQLRGQGVQCLTEEDHFNAEGQREKSVKAGKLAQQWAQTMTERYSALAEHDSTFGQLRNVMDLAVVAALIDMEQLLVRANLELPQMMAGYAPVEYNAPRSVPTKASFIKQRGNWVVSASGGVQLMPWHVADRSEEAVQVGELHQKLATDSGQWYWQ